MSRARGEPKPPKGLMPSTASPFLLVLEALWDVLNTEAIFVASDADER
jgi:hypothetical protein